MADKKRVVALAFSDLHINDWSKFNKDNERTLNHFKVLSHLVSKANKYDCPVLFCGDLLHKAESISNNLFATLQYEMVHMYGDWGLYKSELWAISGNHDMPSANTKEHPSNSWVAILSNYYKFLECIDWQSRETEYIKVWGIPYLDHNIGLNEAVKAIEVDPNKKNILLLHTDYPGAKDTDGVEVGTVENLNTNLLSKFDLVLIGHIHKPQRLSKKVYMVGAPLQQRRTDRNCDMGYLKIYEDMTVKFVNLSEKFPKFIDVEKEEDIKDDGNYYTVVGAKKALEEETQKENRITQRLSKKRLVRRYMKARGIKDDKKQEVLLKVLKEAGDDNI